MKLPGRIAGRGTAAKVGQRSVHKKPGKKTGFEKILKHLKARKIIQIGVESQDSIQILLKTGGYLKMQADVDTSIIYALARNPNSYLKTVRAVRGSGLAGFIQVVMGLSVSRERAGEFSPRDLEILCGDSDEGRDSLRTDVFKYLPDRLIARCLEDLDYRPDLIIFGDPKRIALPEIEETEKLLRSSSYLFLVLPALKDQRKVLKASASGAISLAAECSDPKGILLSVAKAEGRLIAAEKEIGYTLTPQADPKNIAIVLVEHFGDIVACEPVTRYVRSKHPAAHITWVTKDAYREIVEDNPNVDEVLTVGCITEWNLLSRSGLYDKIIDLHIDDRECSTCCLPVRKWRPRRDVTLDNYYNHGPLLSVFSAYAGLPPLDDAPRLYIPERVRARVDSLSLPNEYLVFHCLSNEYSRDWADEKWLELVQQLKKAWGGAIVEIGANACLSERAAPNVIDLCGRVSILESAEIIRRARVFVGIDSGPAHLGNAVGTYGIVLLGDYKAFKHYVPFTGDYASGKNGKLLYSKSGPARRIGVHEVLEEVLHALNETPSNGARAAMTEAAPDAGANVDGPSGRADSVRLIAFHLPQYHPIPENDQWWGKGFTDWRNVVQGRPLFEGHYQPHLPGELGFYDFRVHEVLCRQAEMAKQANIAGFCFWHYWFKGKLLLEQPLVKLLESGQPDFPFCLAWANENWTRRWDGQENAILMQQDYGGQKDDQQHFAWLSQFFRDRRYLKIQDRPLFLIYRPFHVKDAKATLARWRQMARQEGIAEPFFMGIRTNLDSRANVSAIKLGFDGEVAFQPNSPDTYFQILNLTSEMHRLFPDLFSEEIQLLNKKGTTVCEYDQAWPIMPSSPIVQSASSTCIVPSWDNSARRVNQGAFILDNPSPPSYQKWLQCEIERCMEQTQKPQILFLNAWNEWAEGNHLEPDLKFGEDFLEATRRAQEKVCQHAADSRGNLERAVKIAAIQPLIRRTVRAIHRGINVKATAVDEDREGNLLARITEIISAPRRADSTGKPARETLISVIREFMKAYPATPLLTQLYNQASALVVNGKKEAAQSMFSVLAYVTDSVLPDLCGKSHYKLAMLSQNKAEMVRHLAKCVQIFPEHRAASELLQKLKREAKRMKIETASKAKKS